MTDKVNVIIMAHEKIGAAFVHAITTALGELPLPTTVPADGLSVVTTEVATGFTVFQEKFMLQVLAPLATTQEADVGVREPDMVEGAQTLPSQDVPATQEFVIYS